MAATATTTIIIITLLSLTHSSPTRKSTFSIRSRFPSHFHNQSDTDSNKDSAVKITGEGLSRTASFLKRKINSRETDKISSRMGNVRQDEYLFDDGWGPSYPTPPPSPSSSYSGGSSYPAGPPAPVFPNNNNYGHRPAATTIPYKPASSVGSVLPPIIFPPVTMTPDPIITAPIPPPGSTLVPIIGGETDEEEEDLFPPAPPDEIFPPSPPQIEEGVNRVLQLKDRPPARTRISPVGRSQQEPSSSSRERLRTRLMRDRVRDNLRESEEQQRQPEDPNIITDFVFSDIKCFKTRSKEYFGATIHMKRGYHAPYLKNRPRDPLTSQECRMEKIGQSEDVFHMSASDLTACGVEQCGESLCLTMVFPRIPTLALADDEVTTIKCLPQKSTISDTRTVSFAGDSIESRTSSSTVEGGTNDFASDVAIFRQGSNNNGVFNKRVNSGGVVELGEPLQLRSIVKDGDGWKFTRLSDVKVWRMRDNHGRSLENLDPNDASEVITLVDDEGCRNEEYRVVAEKHPLRDPRNNLIHHFPFKAFLFRGQRANEPLIVTAKVVACLEEEECGVKHCGTPPHQQRRIKRSPVEVNNSSAIVLDSKFALRVVDHPASLSDDDYDDDASTTRSLSRMTCTEKMATAGFGGGLIALFLCGIGLALYAYVVRGRSKGHGGTRRPPPPLPPLPHGLHQHHVSNAPNKPLPLPPPQSSPPLSSSTTPTTEPSSEMRNVAKILETLAANSQQRNNNNDDYASVADDTTTTTPPPDKKQDGVYIVYIDKKKGSTRPSKSAPSSLRSKRGSQRRRYVQQELFEQPTSSEDNTTNDSSSSSSSSEGSPKLKKCVGFYPGASRRTVRNVKNRSSHHKQQQDAQQQSHRQKVVNGIRRRLSALYKEGRGSKDGCAGSFPTRWRQAVVAEENKEQLSSSDSAYGGSEVNNNGGVLEQVRRLAEEHHRRSKRDGNLLLKQAATPEHMRDLNNSRSTDPNNNHLQHVHKQIQEGTNKKGVSGETKASHFVTRDDSCTQILIVPETHV